jgi:biopolymer transport protein ExbD
VRFTSQKFKDDPPVNVVSLIDVILNLIVFFVLTTTFVGTSAISVDLPTSSAKTSQEPRELYVTVTKDGKIYVDKPTGAGPVGLEELEKVLSNTARQNKDTLIIVRADEMTTHGTVVAVMDAAKNCGLNRLAIATKSREAVGKTKK